MDEEKTSNEETYMTGFMEIAIEILGHFKSDLIECARKNWTPQQSEDLERLINHVLEGKKDEAL